MLGRSRRLAGACLAHLCVFEMTSVEPMARYAAAIRRLVPDDEHLLDAWTHGHSSLREPLDGSSLTTKDR